MAENKKRLGRRNPLQLFGSSSPTHSEKSSNQQDMKLEVQNQESIVHNQESKVMIPEMSKLYSLSVRVPELLNDALDDATKQTRRSHGSKIPKEVLVKIAIEAMLDRVELGGGWQSVGSEGELRKLLGLDD